MYGDEKEQYKCQIQSLGSMSQPLGFSEVLWQRRNRIKRALKRRINFLTNVIRGMIFKEGKIAASVKMECSKADLHPGDLVLVRSKGEIKTTLNRWNQLNGCSFMEEMWRYCGTTQRVFKRVEKFLDERDYLIKKSKGIVILDGVICEGTKDFGTCDRSCFFFWRQEWLKKIN